MNLKITYYRLKSLLVDSNNLIQYLKLARNAYAKKNKGVVAVSEFSYQLKSYNLEVQKLKNSHVKIALQCRLVEMKLLCRTFDSLDPTNQKDKRTMHFLINRLNRKFFNAQPLLSPSYSNGRQRLKFIHIKNAPGIETITSDTVIHLSCEI